MNGRNRQNKMNYFIYGASLILLFVTAYSISNSRDEPINQAYSPLGDVGTSAALPFDLRRQYTPSWHDGLENPITLLCMALLMTVVLGMAFTGGRDGFLPRMFRRQRPVALQLLDDFDDDEEDEHPLELVPFEENEYSKRLSEVGYEGDIPDAYVDPISREIMFNPVLLLTIDHSTTRSFEEQSILNLMQSQVEPVCPLSRKRFDGYILNRDLKQLIEEWVNKKVKEITNERFEHLPQEASKKMMVSASRLFQRRKPHEPPATPNKQYNLSKSL